VPVRLLDGVAAVGKTLAQLDLRGTTGATVLAIARGDHGMVAPSAQERLAAGDVLALAGTHDAVEAARRILEQPGAGPAGGTWTSGE
jgi:CPA2 family monovalent cation:H+ antiporter-2